MSVQIRTATELIAWYMRTCGFAGWTSFWNTIYVIPSHEHDDRLLRHERKHLEQIESDGRLLWRMTSTSMTTGSLGL